MKKLQAAAAGVLLAAVTAVLAQEDAMAANIQLTVQDKTYQVELYDSTAAQQLLQQLPLKLTFENFGRNERIAYLPHKLGISSYKESVQVKRGDLAYYVPWGNLCVFRVDYHSPDDLMVLGHMGEEAVKAVEQSGDSEVLLQLKP